MLMLCEAAEEESLCLVGQFPVVLTVALLDMAPSFIAFVEIAFGVWFILADRMTSVSQHDAKRASE